MAIWVREGSLGTGSGSSFGNAKSVYDIETWAPTVAPGTEILFHHLDDFHMPGHGNSPFFRVTLNGTKIAPIILRGALPDGSPAPWRARGDRMRVWDRNLRSVQQGKGLFDLDADYVTIQGLQAHHMSWVFRAVGGVGDREGIVMERCHFEQITRILETKNGSDAGGLKYSYFRHITARGHSKALFKIQQTSHYVWLIDIDGDSQFQDGDNFSAGVQFDEDAHHCYVWGSTFRNVRDTLDDYWNGDGVSAESTNDSIEVDGCRFENITDGGVDSKAPNTKIKNSTFIGCKKSVRSWSPSLEIDNIKSFEPVRLGGTGEACHIWHQDGAGPVVAKNSLFVNKTTSVPVLIADADNGNTGSTGRLENCRVIQRADSPYLSTTNGGVTPTADARTTRKLIDPVSAYGSITLGAFTTADNGTASTNPVTIAKPACSVGDLLICQFFMRGAGNISGLSGWTPFSSNFISASGNNKQWIHYKVVDGTEPSSWTISPQFSASVAAAAILVCQGVDPTSPIAASSQANGGAGVSTHATAAFTSPISKTQILHLFGFHSLVTTTPDAATSEVYDYQNTPGAAAIEAATEEFTTFLGTIPSRTATTSANSIWVVDSLALRPLPA
jgi:hypothetical protein